jgi:hypothetical protein
VVDGPTKTVEQVVVAIACKIAFRAMLSRPLVRKVKLEVQYI